MAGGGCVCYGVTLLGPRVRGPLITVTQPGPTVCSGACRCGSEDGGAHERASLRVAHPGGCCHMVASGRAVGLWVWVAGLQGASHAVCEQCPTWFFAGQGGSSIRLDE